jgi:glycosyltransferase involved in cell wall biosynthesis
MKESRKGHTAVIIGAFPAPMHGASAINQSLFELVGASGVPVLRIDLSPGRTRRWAYHLARGSRALSGILRIVFASRELARRYVMSVDGGAGLWYNIFLALAVRSKRQTLLLYHHSSNYVRADSYLMRLLLKAAGQNVRHAMCSAEMFSAYCRRYGLQGSGFIVNNSAWVRPTVRAASDRGGRMRLGHLGGLTREKGLERAIETLREVKKRGIDAELVLAGAPLDAAAQETIASAQKEFGSRLQYAGILAGAAKDNFYANLDYFLFPSLYRHETQSLVVPEALAAEVPVVAYDHRFVGEVVGEGGLLIPAEDSFALAAAEWIVSGSHTDRRLAARNQFRKLRLEAAGQIDLILEWAGADLDECRQWTVQSPAHEFDNSL